MIYATHALIDRYRLARFVVFAKNWTTQPSLQWDDCSATGYHKDTPPWLAFWLLIIADNTMHLMINYAALPSTEKKIMEKLKWYVTWYPECNGWAVMKGDFRDSWYRQKYEAEQWAAFLNAKDDSA